MPMKELVGVNEPGGEAAAEIVVPVFFVRTVDHRTTLWPQHALEHVNAYGDTALQILSLFAVTSKSLETKS